MAGIFMGIIVALIILSILGVGLKALSSLEVSYGAFDKEMGPAAQKKQQ
jgi:Na+-transporting methylmalonyl-CoA/oxaloacetate decarboxylase gamma subunit